MPEAGLKSVPMNFADFSRARMGNIKSHQYSQKDNNL